MSSCQFEERALALERALQFHREHPTGGIGLEDHAIQPDGVILTAEAFAGFLSGAWLPVSPEASGLQGGELQK
jgi:hypothetical protein